MSEPQPQLTKKEFEDLADKLYDVQLRKGMVEEEERSIKGRLKTYMAMHNIPQYETDLYRLDYKFPTTYQPPKPAQVRELLGKGAEEYIYEVVDPSLRQALPPQSALELFTKIEGTPYVSCTKKPTKL
jgi:hypothetical protein